MNYAPGNEATNLVTVPLDADGRICVFSFERTDVVIDLLGRVRRARGSSASCTSTASPSIRPSGPTSTTTAALHGRHQPVTFTRHRDARRDADRRRRPPAAPTTSALGHAWPRTPRSWSRPGTDEYWVRCLPADFPLLTTEKTGAVAPGYYLLENGVAGGSGRFVMILDTNGVPVWYRRVPASIDFKQLPDGNLAWMNFVRANFNIDPTKRYEVHTLDGTPGGAPSAPVRAS